MAKNCFSGFFFLSLSQEQEKKWIVWENQKQITIYVYRYLSELWNFVVVVFAAAAAKNVQYFLLDFLSKTFFLSYFLFFFSRIFAFHLFNSLNKWGTKREQNCSHGCVCIIQRIYIYIHV